MDRVADADGSGANERGRFLSVVARLKDGVTVDQAAAELRTIEARLSDEAPQFNKNYSAEVLPLREQFFGNVRRPLWLMLGAVGFVLLIACANVANLLLSLATSREKEIAVRAALGARRGRIVRQLLTESLLAGIARQRCWGWVSRGWGSRHSLLISPRDLVSLQSVGLNVTVLLWTLGVSILTGIIFGLAPALHISRLNLNDSLKEGGKSESGQASGSRRLRNALVVSEIALAVVLLASAGLLIRSFMRLAASGPRFQYRQHSDDGGPIARSEVSGGRASSLLSSTRRSSGSGNCRTFARRAWLTFCRCTAAWVLLLVSRSKAVPSRRPARVRAPT